MPSPPIQKVSVQLPEGTWRIETGPVQFNDDWPGIFIRGDNAFFYASALEVAIQSLRRTVPNDMITVAALEALKLVLQSSRISGS